MIARKLFSAAVLVALPALAQSPGAASSDDLSKLPLIEMRAASDTSGILAIFLTGDGGWADLDKQVTAELRSRGVDVVGLNTRPYLSKKKEPAEIAFDVARIARHYMKAWNRPRLALVGYSRGADLMPFAVSGMAADVRDRIVLLAMLGISTRTGFEFHFEDILFEVKRASDRFTLPVLALLRGMKMMCVYGAKEPDSACRDAPAGLFARKVELPGGHHYDDNFKHVGDLVFQEIPSVTGAPALPAQH